MKSNSKEPIPGMPWDGIMTGMDINRASTWLRAHSNHVKNLMQIDDTAPIYPSAEDVKQPAQWKACHWKWFFQATKTQP